eukprot:9491154-Pyramimonas_sp.AAC.1
MPPPMMHGRVVRKTWDRPGELLFPSTAAPRATFESNRNRRTGHPDAAVLAQTLEDSGLEDVDLSGHAVRRDQGLKRR